MCLNTSRPDGHASFEIQYSRRCLLKVTQFPNQITTTMEFFFLVVLSTLLQQSWSIECWRIGYGSVVDNSNNPKFNPEDSSTWNGEGSETIQMLDPFTSGQGFDIIDINTASMYMRFHHPNGKDSVNPFWESMQLYEEGESYNIPNDHGILVLRKVCSRQDQDFPLGTNARSSSRYYDQSWRFRQQCPSLVIHQRRELINDIRLCRTSDTISEHAVSLWIKHTTWCCQYQSVSSTPEVFVSSTSLTVLSPPLRDIKAPNNQPLNSSRRNRKRDPNRYLRNLINRPF